MFKNFMKDYKELLYEPQWEFVRRHKVFYGTFLGLCFLGGCAIGYIHNKIDERNFTHIINQDLEELIKEEEDEA